MNFPNRLIKILVILMSVATTNVPAQTTNSSGFTLNGYAEIYYSYDSDNPENHLRPPFIFCYNRSNEVNVNLAMIKLTYSKERVRGNLSLMAGTYANANLASETGTLKNIYEANAGVKLAENTEVWLDAGIMTSHIGFESAIGKDCWALTRSLCTEGSPYYETGVKISYVTDNNKWHFAGLILNGWQRTTRVNGNNTVAFGTQISFKTADNLLINNSTFVGNDFPDSSKVMRYFADTYLTYNISKVFSVTAGYDIGIQQKSSNSSDYLTWYAPIFIIKSNLSKLFSATARFEYFYDPSQIIFSTGTTNGFKTIGYSLNVDYQITYHALFRVECRLFDSKDAIFMKGNELKRANSAITSSLSIVF